MVEGQQGDRGEIQGGGNVMVGWSKSVLEKRDLIESSGPLVLL
jgi:hypothetical protein